MPRDAIVADIIAKLNHSDDAHSIMQMALTSLTHLCHADRGLIWQVVGDHITVTNEFAVDGHVCFEGNQLGPQESTAIVLEFLARFPDETGRGILCVPDTAQDPNLKHLSPTLASLVELGDVTSRLMAQIRSNCVFSGFIELQHCKTNRDWRRFDETNLGNVAAMISVVVQHASHQERLKLNTKEMKLMSDIAMLFREASSASRRDIILKSVKLLADHLGFERSQIYLFSAADGLLVPQIQNDDGSLDLTQKDNPFVSVFETKRSKSVNAEFSPNNDPVFGHDLALLVPLILNGDCLGVMGVWRRLPNMPEFRPQDRELSLSIASYLAIAIRLDATAS